MSTRFHTLLQVKRVWSFQYKILNRILFTNAKLFKIGLKESEKCSFCKTPKEEFTFSLTAPMHKNFGRVLSLGGIVLVVKA